MAKDSLDALLEQAEETLEKGGDLSEIDSDHHGKVKEVHKKESIEDRIKHAKIAEDQKDNDESQEETTDSETKDKAETKVEKKKKTKKGKAKVRSKKYQEVLALIDRNKKYELEEALELVKKTSLTKFDGNVELHVRVLGKSGKAEALRGMVQYPFATGKTTTVVILDDKTIEEIAKTGKADADIYITTPADMPKVAKLAKILGPKGKMPNPKSGTITEDTAKAKKDLEGGSTEYRADNTGNIHQTIGKVSGKIEALKSNYDAFMSLLPKEKIVSITLCATMGPGLRIQK